MFVCDANSMNYFTKIGCVCRLSSTLSVPSTIVLKTGRLSSLLSLVRLGTIQILLGHHPVALITSLVSTVTVVIFVSMLARVLLNTNLW